MLELGEQPYTEADAEWDAFVAAHPHGSLLQTTNWARLKNRFGWTSERVWMKRDGRLVAGAQVLFRSLALGVVKLAYVPHGPLVDWRDDEQVAVLFNQIDQAAYRRGAGLLKMEPRLWQTSGRRPSGRRSTGGTAASPRPTPSSRRARSSSTCGRAKTTSWPP
jgi:lipid II:glycine glycyltransferase (peptidoglycan interpeptide bridge formation enzyme)